MKPLVIMSSRWCTPTAALLSLLCVLFSAVVVTNGYLSGSPGRMGLGARETRWPLYAQTHTDVDKKYEYKPTRFVTPGKLSSPRRVPEDISRPSYARTGIVNDPDSNNLSAKIEVLDFAGTDP
jgi:hypothetical protein